METKLIMLVEDNPDDITLTKRALKKSAILNPLFVAQDGQEALDYLIGTPSSSLETGNSLPLLIMLDLRVPKVDGLEVLREIRKNERTRSIPVVILTSSKEDIDLIVSYHLGVNSFIRKPLDFNQFAETIRQLGL